MRNSEINHRAFEAAKHIYDIAVIADHPKICALLADKDRMGQLLEIRMTEERERLDGIPGICPIDFIFSHKPEIMRLSKKPMRLCRTSMFCVTATELILRAQQKR